MERVLTLALIYGATHSLLQAIRSSNTPQATDFAKEVNQGMKDAEGYLVNEINRLRAESFQKGLEARQ